MLYLVVTYDPGAKLARPFVVMASGEAEAFDKVARLMPTVAEYGAATVRLSDFLTDVAAVDLTQLEELSIMVDPGPGE